MPLNEGVEENKILEFVEMILEFNRKQQGKGLKTLTPNQMLSRLPISLAQLKAGNNSEKLKNEIRQLFILCTDQKNLQNNSKNIWLILLKNGKIFVNIENSKTNEPHTFRLHLTDKLDLKDPRKNMGLTNLSIYSNWKNIKSEYNNNRFKIFPLTWNDTFNLPDGS